MAQSKLVNIPNLITFYRLLVSPVIFWAVYAREHDLFVILLCISLVSDILDGLLARALKQETEFGSRIDSYADILTYIAAVAGLLIFKADFVSDHSIHFIVLLSAYVLPEVVGVIKFGRVKNLHLYMTKASGYVLGILFFTIFVAGYAEWYFNFAIVFSVLAYLEQLAVLLYLKKLKSNARGLYFLLKSSKS